MRAWVLALRVNTLQDEFPDGPKKDAEVKVTMKGNVLRIEGKHEEEGKEETRSFRRFNEFRRLFRLPENVNAEAITAEMVNGLLTVKLPKVDVQGENEDKAA